MQKRISQEILPGILFLLLGLVMRGITPGQVRTTEKSFFTAQTFPYITIGIILLCSTVLILMGVIHILLDRSAGAAVGRQQSGGGNVLMLVEVLALVIAAVFLGSVAGLLVSGLLVSCGFLAIYKDKAWSHYVIVAAIVVGFYFLFKLAFGLNLP